MELLTDLHGDGLTLVLVTHDVEIGAAAPRLVRMVDGRIVEDVRRNVLSPAEAGSAM